METRQFEEAAQAFKGLEEKALKERKFQCLGRYGAHLDVLAIAFGKLSKIGEERLFKIRLDGHLPIGRTAFGIAKRFMVGYVNGRTRSNKVYEDGIYEALACVCEAAKELYDYGY